MAAKKIEYGKKQMVYQNKRNEESPLFVLVDRYVESDNRTDPTISADACYCPDCRKVFDIEHTSMQRSRFGSPGSGECDLVLEQDSAEEFAAKEIACPECHKSGRYAFIQRQHSGRGEPDTSTDGNRINYEGSWRIPPMFSGRYVFTFTDEEDRPTRIDDNFMFDNAVVFPSGKVYSWQNEYSQTSDFVRNRVISYATRIDGNGRTPVGKVKDATDCFKYPDANAALGPERRVNVQDASMVYPRINMKIDGCYNVTDFRDDVLLSAFGRLSRFTAFDTYVHKHDDGPNTYNTRNETYTAGMYPPVIKDMFNEVSSLKSHTAAERFEGKFPHPIYTDLVNNGLNLMSHTKDSTEINTDCDKDKRSFYTYMMIRYPGAVEFAVQRAENRVMNYEFAEKRKAEADPSYEAKKATDSARAKFFREEMKYVSEQLCACDDKVLTEISLAGTNAPCYVFHKGEDGKGKIEREENYQSPSGDNSALNLMKDRLSFFVYGLRDGYPVPSDIAVKLKDSKTLSEATQSTKKLKSLFNTNPIATASNVYTLSKWNIKDTNHVKLALDLVAEQSPNVNPPDIRCKGTRRPGEREYKGFVNADVLAPVRLSSEMRFLRLYEQTHDTTAMINEILDNREFRSNGWMQFVENINLYHSIITNPHVDIIQTAKDVDRVKASSTKSLEAQHEENKTQLRNYLINSGRDGLQTAYRDFTPYYGKNTKEKIDALAREIKQDVKMDEIKRFADKNGMDAALAAYKDDLARFENPQKAVENHTYFSDRSVVIPTRNNKPLFERRLEDIHDELSEMGRKCVTENEYLELPSKVLDLNDTIETDISKLPESQWDENPKTVPEGTMGSFSFHVMENRFDFIRTSTDLRNCVGTEAYFNDMKHGIADYVFMRDENNNVAVCIELIPKRDEANDTDYYVKQFQGYRDCVVDKKFYPVFTEWCKKHKIDYQRDPAGNVNACANGEKRWFYGGGTADYHHEEYDPVFNTSVSVSKAERLKNERTAKAIEIYGECEPGSPNLPGIPEDLSDLILSV